MKILDCTLRDGGYYTSWDFSDNLITKYFTLMENLPIEYIEIGYRNKEKDLYFGEYFYLPISTFKRIRNLTSKKIAIMLNAKDCQLDDTNYLLDEIKDYVSLVRIATDPLKIQDSLILSKKIKELGFEVAINLMYISSIDKYHSLFNYLSEVHLFTDIINLVDSYGSIYPTELKELILNIKNCTDLPLGFHGHNNLELAFANTLTAIENDVEFIDSTILGMGRGAGNLKTELLLSHLSAKGEFNINLNILSQVTELFLPLIGQYKWGTNLAYMTSGSYSLPQKEVMNALEINRYSLSGIVNQLKKENHFNLPLLKEDRIIDKCILIGGGDSVLKHISTIKEYLLSNKEIIIIHSTSKYINYFDNLENIQYFAVAGEELLKVVFSNKISKYILEPTPRKVNYSITDQTNFYEFERITFINKYHDSPLTISLQITIELQSQDIYLVGFDGYSKLKNSKELYLMHENQEIINNFIQNKNLISLTNSKYKNLIEKSIYGMISNESK